MRKPNSSLLKRHLVARRAGFLCLVLGYALCGSILAHGQPSNGPFVAVLIDNKTERAMGPFPYDRAVLAKVVQRSHEMHAKGVVIKFFLNLPRSADGDRLLASAMGKTRVILQAGNTGDGETSAAILDRFSLGAASSGNAITANRGGIPLSQFLIPAYDVGFVDMASMDRVPIVEQYGGRYVKSLWTACVELALDRRATVVPGQSVAFGDKRLALDEKSQAGIRLPSQDSLNYISLVDFLSDQKTGGDIKDRVVVVGLDDSTVPTVQTQIGALRVHRLFLYVLQSFYQSVIAAPTTRSHVQGRP